MLLSLLLTALCAIVSSPSRQRIPLPEFLSLIFILLVSIAH
ncbi:unnamed protein product, partial [Arabidopsis halleri]